MVISDRVTRFFGGNCILAMLIFANVAAALILWVVSLVLHFAGGRGEVLDSLLALPSDTMDFATHPWTLVTYSFVHYSPLHLLFNMLWLYWFGRMLSDVERSETILKLYLWSTVAGGVFYILASLVTDYGPGSYLTGASAGVLGIMCAVALRMPNRTVMLFLLGEVRIKWIAIVCVVLTLAGSGIGLQTQCAHIGGILTGVVWFMLRRRLRRANRRSNPGFKSRNIKSTIRVMQRSVPDHQRLDELLDKVRISGYDSLSNKEKAELNHISSRLS